MRIKKGTVKLVGTIRQPKPPPEDKVLKRNGPPVKTIVFHDYQKMLRGEWSPWD